MADQGEAMVGDTLDATKGWDKEFNSKVLRADKESALFCSRLTGLLTTIQLPIKSIELKIE